MNRRNNTSGLIIGKFYPLHKGHNFLIDTALSQVDELTIIIGEKKYHDIPGSVRAEWIKKVHPKVHHVYVIKEEKDISDPTIWAQETIKLIGHKPDFVFSSEDYGETFAKSLGSTHVLVDKERVQIPISATKIRSNPLNYLAYLDPIVQEYFVKNAK